MAGMEGIEPSLTEPESAVLPLDDIPMLLVCRTDSQARIRIVRIFIPAVNGLEGICTPT